MLIGDQFKLHLLVNHAPDVKILQVDLSKMKDVPEVEVIQQTAWDTLSQGAEFVLKQDLTLMAFDSGAYFIPAIPFVYEQNGQQGTAMTNELLIEVAVPVIDSTYLAPIKPIIRESLSAEDFLPVGIILAILALLGGLFYYFYQKRNEVPPPPPVVIPAHEIALKKLTDLKQNKLWQKGEVKAYQSQLTFIVREYLEGRYNVQALESTTNEILTQLNPIHLSDDWKVKLKEMLQLADLVKFAKAEPPVEAHDRLMVYAEDFVLTTRQKVLETTPAEDQDTSINDDVKTDESISEP